MKAFLKRYCKVNIKILAVGAAICLMLSLLPLLIIGGYAHPCADDYGYSAEVRAAWTSTHSLSSALKASAQTVQNNYNTWQGTFTSIFLMSFCPAIWGQEWYVLTPIMMMGSILISHFLLLYVILVRGLKTNRWVWCFITSILCLWMFQTMHSPVNALYWYNGAVHYTFMHGIMVCALAFMGWMFLAEKRGERIAAMVLASLCSFICGGANYATALLGIVCVAGMLILFSALRKRVMYCGFLPLLCCGIAFYYNVSAMGNSVRQSNFVGQTPIAAVISSFEAAFWFMGDWLNLQSVIFLLLLLPVIWNMAGESRFGYRFPAVISLFSVCLSACMFTPLFYAMGGAGVDRHTNIVKMWFQLLIVLNMIYWTGWLRKKFIMKNMQHYVGYYAVVAVFLICHFSFSDRVLHDYASYAAYVSLSAGEARLFHEEFLERTELLDGEEQIVALKAYSVKPYLLYFDDITTEAGDWRNSAMARWYQKQSIYLEE